jgi:hypothetical protein
MHTIVRKETANPDTLSHCAVDNPDLEPGGTGMRMRWNAFYLVALALCLAAAVPSAPHAQAKPPAPAPAGAATSAIQSQDTNVTGVVAELTECTRKDGVLSVKVRLHNTSAAKAAFLVIQHKDYEKFYLTAENKKYFILTDSEKVQLATQPDTYDGSLQAIIAAGGSYQWWAKYPAPPASVKTLTFYTPWGPPFDDVPIVDK